MDSVRVSVRLRAPTSADALETRDDARRSGMAFVAGGAFRMGSDRHSSIPGPNGQVERMNRTIKDPASNASITKPTMSCAVISRTS